jgi:hypothetical protein
MKIVKTGLIILLALGMTVLSYAASNVSPETGKATSERTPWVKHADVKGTSDKVDRGLRGLLFGWTAIPKSIIETTKESKNPFWGLTAGTWLGITKAVPKTVSGTGDMMSLQKKDTTKPLVSSDQMQPAASTK